MSVLTPEGTLARWRQLIATSPNIYDAAYEDETRLWLARATALAEIQNIGDAVSLKSAVSRLYNPRRGMEDAISAADEITNIVLRMHAVAELKAPIGDAGSFVTAGSSFEALAAVTGVLERAATDLIVVDPYLDGAALTKFIVSAAPGVEIRLLSDAASVKPTLAPAVDAWVNQYGQARPLSARLAQARTLHDRLIIVDRRDAYVLTQSLNAFAARAPASIVKADAELAGLKSVAYEAIWAASAPL